MVVSERGLNRATLGRQLLLRREPLGVVEATRRIVAIQGQQAASPYVALWNRIDGFEPDELDAAFARRELVKATLMRFTLHVVHAEDHLPMHKAMQPSLRTRLGDARYTEAGLTRDDADAVIAKLLEFLAEPRSNAEIEAWLQDQIDGPPKSMWWALRAFMPVLHSPTGGPWAFGYRPTYRAAVAAHTPLDPDASDAALQTLVWRYLEGFGPATMADIAQFASVQRARARAAIEALGNKLETLEGPDGKDLYDVPGGLRPDEDTPAPSRFLPMWDSTLLAYADRGRLVPAEYRKIITRTNGDTLPTLLVDGYVAGVWRTVDDGIEATAFHRLPAKTWKELAVEARALTKFLAKRDPHPYSRYHHWWAKLPDHETRVLPRDVKKRPAAPTEV
ncbi:winged helix DNA-binding domain-containing protein [Kribbella monticola]|uniref:winged helix DNA-binding domain-containing protein n=1 Tax=Kribbella monticola TaxID=2185285 RepID=UPI000DD33DFF|nr:winged helix DNA-binding domain-containing protein [Kribbella monticola]